MDNMKNLSFSINSPSMYYAKMLVGLVNEQVNDRESEYTHIGCFKAGPFVVHWPVSNLHMKLIEYIMNEDLDKRYGAWSFKHMLKNYAFLILSNMFV